MEQHLFGFIGTGHMGSALARVAVAGTAPDCVWLANRTAAKAEAHVARSDKTKKMLLHVSSTS